MTKLVPIVLLDLGVTLVNEQLTYLKCRKKSQIMREHYLLKRIRTVTSLLPLMGSTVGLP